jgi:cytochrome c biogenesis protein CcdA
MEKFFECFGKSMRSILGFTIVILSFGFLFVLMYKRMPAENKDIITLSAGIVLGVLGTVAAYYFGSSKDKSDQDKADNLAR